MSKKEQILYQDPRKASFSDLTDALSMSFSTVEEEHDQNLQGNIALAQTEHRERQKHNQEAIFKKYKEGALQMEFQFDISVDLIALFRAPEVDHQSNFTPDYLSKVKKELQMCRRSCEGMNEDQYVIYLHFIFSIVENIQDMKELGVKQLCPISDHLQKLNIMNPFHIAACIQNFSKQDKNSSLQALMKKHSSKVGIQVVLQNNVCYYDQRNNTLIISKRSIKKAIDAHGEMDLHFSSFLVSKLTTFTPLLYYFAICKGALLIQNRYGLAYEEMLMDEQRDNSSGYQLLKPDSQENWYNEQLNLLINGKFEIEELKSRVVSGQKNRYLEKLLIGLQGWGQKYTEDSTILLNVYYDGVDWQLSSPFKPSISQVGEPFYVNYLIENKQNHKNNLILCLKAPCMGSQFRREIFSWHRLKVNKYSTDGEAYLWLERKFQNFQHCGFYDWKIFELTEDGRNEDVSKIVNISDNRKYGSQIMSKKIYSVKPVQGRIIVHPRGTRQMQIHEIYMDSLSSNQGKRTIPHFQDAFSDIKRCSEIGIDCAYIMGVYQRDNGKFSNGFKRPHASPMALTSRVIPCEMFGGSYEFSQLMKNSHQKGIKIITDCTTRVSSSRYNKCYEPFTLHYIDEYGRKYPLYGAEGRSVNYQDTTILNYRKLQSWQLLIDETCQLVEKYKIDGIYMDNGIDWPQIFEIDYDQMERKQGGQRFYTNQQIFDGQIVIKNRPTGFWTSKISHYYPNPFYIKLVKKLWNSVGDFLFVCESFEIEDKDEKTINAIQSGLIPRTFKMPKAVAQLMGINLKENGTILSTQPKNTITLKKWYEQTIKNLPKNAITIQSTSSHAWPYPAFLFKKATWAFIDLIFFLPQIPMTFIGEQEGRAYRSKAASIFFDAAQNVVPDKGIKRASSSFFSSSAVVDSKGQKIISSTNATVKDPSQIKYLEETFRRQVGPEFGFDLAEIHKHYGHRRKLRKQLKLLTSGKMLSVTAEHIYGIHKNILSFAKFDEKQILLISINFNANAIDMHYNLNNFKYIFTKPYQSNLIVKVQEIMGKSGFQESYYTASQLITSRLEAHIEAYQSIIWRMSFPQDISQEEVYQLSCKRIITQISSEPAKWIYSSIFTNELSRMLENTKSLKPFVKKLQYLYEKLIIPNNLNFNLVISKTYQFWLNRAKLSKLFGIFKLLQEFPDINQELKSSVKRLIEGNSLGPIAFITPEIGKWSSVGGLGVMVDQLSKQLVKLGEEVYIITPYYEYNKKRETNYLIRDGFTYDRNIKVWASHLGEEFGIHRGKYQGVNYIWFHNPNLFSRPYEGESATYVCKQLVFFALASLEACCQLQIFPSTIITNDWMCGFVSAYVKVNKYAGIFNGTKFMHICHNLDPLYEGRLYPKFEQGDLNWLVQLPSEWYIEYRDNKMIVNPSKCALETCDNWGTVSNSYKYDLLKDSPLSHVLWKHANPFSFPNGVRKEERISLMKTKTPGTHKQSKKLLQQKYFGFYDQNDEIPIFSFIGRITKQKGVHLIVDSVQALLYEFNFRVQFIVGGLADSKEEYGKYCAERMRYLHHKYPKCFWAAPDDFFTDGPLANIGSDYALMPSQFEPGGIVQHEFFCGGTPVVAFRTGGLKDTVFEFDPKTGKGNGFNFMSYDAEDFKRCVRRALQAYKNKKAYQRLRQNAFDSVVEEEDVAKGWNTEFYRLQNKIYIDWNGVQKQILALKQSKEDGEEDDNWNKIGVPGAFWSGIWDIKHDFKAVLKNAQRLKAKEHVFTYETTKIPRPTEVCISGSWDNWGDRKKMHFDNRKKNWVIHFKLKPGTYYYKFVVENEWVLCANKQIQIDINGNQNHVVVVE